MVMAWRRIGDKPLPEPMMAQLCRNNKYVRFVLTYWIKMNSFQSTLFQFAKQLPLVTRYLRCTRKGTWPVVLYPKRPTLSAILPIHNNNWMAYPQICRSHQLCSVDDLATIMATNSIRKSNDYVYGIWVYQALGIWKGYYRVKKNHWFHTWNREQRQEIINIWNITPNLHTNSHFEMWAEKWTIMQEASGSSTAPNLSYFFIPSSFSYELTSFAPDDLGFAPIWYWNEYVLLWMYPKPILQIVQNGAPSYVVIHYIITTLLWNGCLSSAHYFAHRLLRKIRIFINCDDYCFKYALDIYVGY